MEPKKKKKKRNLILIQPKLWLFMYTFIVDLWCAQCFPHKYFDTCGQICQSWCGVRRYSASAARNLSDMIYFGEILIANFTMMTSYLILRYWHFFNFYTSFFWSADVLVNYKRHCAQISTFGRGKLLFFYV